MDFSKIRGSKTRGNHQELVLETKKSSSAGAQELRTLLQMLVTTTTIRTTLQL
ncbi:hypothetical protein OROGR_005212 [Orobanche gracilis]